MKILLVNDDGFECKGITTLAERLSKEHTVTVVAPDGERSGYSHAMTFGKPVKFEKVDRAYTCYKSQGTPCDCVKYGLLVVDDFDCLISGINTTANVGTDCVYSGTVNAASEGAIIGKPSIAVSAEIGDGDYSYVADFIAENLTALLSLSNEEFFVNVNFPSGDKSLIKGLEYTRCGIKRFNDYYDHRVEGSALLGTPKDIPNAKDTDVDCLDRGMISVSVIKMDFTVSDLSSYKEVKLCW